MRNGRSCVKARRVNATVELIAPFRSQDRNSELKYTQIDALLDEAF